MIAPQIAQEKLSSGKVTPIIRSPVIALGLLFSLLAFWLVIRMEALDQTGLPTGLNPYYHVIVILLALVGLNRLVRRFAPRLAATRGELLCWFSMMSAASSFACWEMLGTQIPAIAYPARWLSGDHPESADIATRSLATLPKGVLVTNSAAAYGLFQGDRYSHWWEVAGWGIPLLLWSGLLLVTVLMSAATARLLMPRWRDEERLSFPLVALPLAITEEDSTLFRNRLFWMGFVAAAGLDLVNGLGQLYPAIPAFNFKVIFLPAPFGWASNTPIGQALGALPITFHPLVFALAYFLPLDVLFSCWFFYLLGKAELVWAGGTGIFSGSPYQFGGSIPGLNEQNAGACLALATLLLWGARSTLTRAWQSAFDTGTEPAVQQARIDFGTLLVGSLIWAGALYWLGIPLWAILPMLIGSGLLAILVARLRSEMGLPVHNLQYLGPDLMLVSFFGSSTLGERGLFGMMSVHGLLRSRQGDILPHFFEGRFLAGVTGSPRRFGIAVVLAAIIAAVVGPWLFVVMVRPMGLENTIGGYNPVAAEGWNQCALWLSHPTPPDLKALLITIIGAVVVLLLVRLRLLWPGSPFHPLGYAICGTWGLSMVVTPLFLAWTVKWLTLRYRGLAGYRSLIPFMYGILLGEFCAGIFWSLVSVLLHQPTYRIWLF